MKLIKKIAFSTLLTLGIFLGVLYTSCSKDACKTVNCLHGCICSGGSCTPTTADSGVGGTNCQIIYRDAYTNTYLGNAVVSYTNVDSAYLDSGYVSHTDDSNTIQFQAGADTLYAQMLLTWKDGKKQMLSNIPITLVNNSSTGSTFTVRATLGGPGDTFTVSGNGSVSNTNASLNLIAVPKHPTTPTIYYTLSNCSKQ